MDALTLPMTEFAHAHDDRELLLRLAKGDAASFRALYERYRGPVYRFAWHMSGNHATGEEVTQEVFMALIRNPKLYDPAKGSVAGYLFGIARNLARRRVEQTRLDEPIPEDWACGDDNGVASDADLLGDLTSADLLERLRQAVHALPEQYREVIVLCELEEMSYPQAAEVLQCAEGTVASRLHRARTMLRTKLKCQGCLK